MLGVVVKPPSTDRLNPSAGSPFVSRRSLQVRADPDAEVGIRRELAALDPLAEPPAPATQQEVGVLQSSEQKRTLSRAGCQGAVIIGLIQRPQLTLRDAVGQGERVTPQDVDVLVAQR